MNHGVIPGRRDSDFIAGNLPYEIRNPSGNWTPYLPTPERQSNRRVDTMACVSYSLLNVIETQIKFFTGEARNYSDRFLAKMSDTTPQGNYLWKVADTVRHSGIVSQLDWPEPPDFTWETYYSPIPPEVQSKGKQFLENWTVAYEWVPVTKEELLKHLKHAPLQLVIPGHAVMGFYNEQDVVNYFDTYDPFQKQTTVPRLTDALKFVITPKFMPQISTQQKGNELRIVLKCATMTEFLSLCAVLGKDPKNIDERI